MWCFLDLLPICLNFSFLAPFYLVACSHVASSMCFFYAIFLPWMEITWVTWGFRLQLGPVYFRWHIWKSLVHQVPEPKWIHICFFPKCYTMGKGNIFFPNAWANCQAREAFDLQASKDQTWKPKTSRASSTTTWFTRCPSTSNSTTSFATWLLLQGAAWAESLGNGAILDVLWLLSTSTCCLELWPKGSHTCGRWTSRFQHGLWLAWSGELGLSTSGSTLEKTGGSNGKGYHSLQGQTVLQEQGRNLALLKLVNVTSKKKGGHHSCKVHWTDIEWYVLRMIM